MQQHGSPRNTQKTRKRFAINQLKRLQNFENMQDASAMIVAAFFCESREQNNISVPRGERLGKQVNLE